MKKNLMVVTCSMHGTAKTGYRILVSVKERWRDLARRENSVELTSKLLGKIQCSTLKRIFVEKFNKAAYKN
jgi:hypothetical protein